MKNIEIYKHTFSNDTGWSKMLVLETTDEVKGWSTYTDLSKLEVYGKLFYSLNIENKDCVEYTEKCKNIQMNNDNGEPIE